MVYFFTDPPDRYYYIMINANQPNLSYIRKHKRVIKKVIVDSGIEIFKNPRIREYPMGRERWITHQVKLYNTVRSIVPRAEVYVTIPDYCDDYVEEWGRPHNLWIGNRTNVDRTLENIELALKRYPDVNWLIPVQGFYEMPDSLISTLIRLSEMGVLDDFDYFAIANLCTTRRSSVIIDSVKRVWNWLSLMNRNKRLHVFGASMTAIVKIHKYLYSFDTTAWTKPIGILKKLGFESSCMGGQRKLYYYAWLHTLVNIYKVEVKDIDPEFVKSQFRRLLLEKIPLSKLINSNIDIGDIA